MKIAILLGSAHVGGGTYVIFQHALYLVRLGWKVTVVTEEPVSQQQLDWHKEAKEQLLFKTYNQLEEEEFDIALATWWRTVFLLHRVKAASYQYFVQSIESRFFPDWDRAAYSFAESTYFMKLPTVTEAKWIKGYLSTNYGTCSELVPNGIRKDLYTEEGAAIAPREPGKLRVLVEGPLRVFFKNVERTVALCKQSKADEIWLLTSSPDCTDYPGVDRTFSCVPIQKVAEIYRSCDVIVKLSYVEGMFGPPLEMFHCGGTAIVYDVTGHDEYMENGVNSIVLKRDDEEGVIQAINRLRDDRTLLENLKLNARRTADLWPDWDTSSKLFAEAVLRLRQQECESQIELKAKARIINNWYTDHVQLQSTLRAAKDNVAGAVADMGTAEMLQMILNSRSFRLIQRLRGVRGYNRAKSWARRGIGVCRAVKRLVNA